MKQMNDVDVLFEAIDENPDHYQEIVQHQDAIKSLGRWPLISAINQVTPIEKAKPAKTKPAMQPSQKSVAVTEQVISEIVMLTQTQTAVTEEAEVITLAVDEVLAVEVPVVEQQPAVVNAPIEEKRIKPFHLNQLINTLVVDTAHIKSASTENISSLFERLNRS